jgi:ubiquinol-cytochrome c reductase iron-sulfur subunit/rieske iron-sulfur protein
MSPQIGDLLVRASGTDLTPLTPDDIVLDARPINAWPADPATGKPRDGTLFNLLLLSRWNLPEMTADAQANAVDGVIANTVICTHAGCEITDWVEDQKIIECPCHYSRFNLRQNGAVAQGPAARKLPALGLALSGNNIVVAKAFDGRLGGDAE